MQSWAKLCMPRDSSVYLEDILEAIARIRRYTRGLSREAFADDERPLDAVVRNLEVIGEAVKQLSAAAPKWLGVSVGLLCARRSSATRNGRPRCSGRKRTASGSRTGCTLLHYAQSWRAGVEADRGGSSRRAG